jgi:hypothetical protein
MDENIKLIIEQARLLNPDFDNMFPQQQYEFINQYVDNSFIKEDLEFYYDWKFGWPYDSKEFIKLNG